MATSIRILGPRDTDLLRGAPEGVFDDPVDPAAAAESLADPRHHIAAALEGETRVEYATGVDYVQPDMPALEL